MRKTHKPCNLYSIHDQNDKAVALILAKNKAEATRIWNDQYYHEKSIADKDLLKDVRFKEIIKNFQVSTLTSLLSEKKIKPGQSLFCTKLTHYYDISY